MKWKRARVLVTGGCGFLGSNLVRTLLMQGAEVAVIDNLSTGFIDNISCDDVSFHKLDISNPVDMEEFANETESFDIMYHLGSPCSVRQYQEGNNPLPVLLNQIRGMDFAIKMCLALEIPMLVYPSSGNIYGNLSFPQSELDIPMPNNYYALGKYASECIGMGYSDPFFTTVGLRIFLGYGPYEEKKGNLSSIAYQTLISMMKDERPIIYGDGKQTRDFIYVTDIMEAFLASADLDESIVTNVGTGVATDFNTLVKTINRILGKNLEPKYVGKPDNYVNGTVAKTDRMRDMLDITETISLEDGLKMFHNYLQVGGL